MRLEISAPPTTDPASLAISPDGQKIVFVAMSEGRPRLWLRTLDSVSSRVLAGTDYARAPFWSPDNRSLGFFAGGKLKRIEIDGGSAQSLADAPDSLGGTWNRDGTILFVKSNGNPIFRVSAMGGESAAVTHVMRPQQTSHRFPRFLPDDRHFLYFVTGNPDARGVYISSLDGLEPRRLLGSDTAAAAINASSGQLLFVREGTLFAQNLDPVKLTLTGNAFTVAEQVVVDGPMNLAALSASPAGSIAYRTGLSGVQRQF